MIVPDVDDLCRYIRHVDWNPEEQRPKESLFKADVQKLSLFHVQRVTQNGGQLNDLCIDTLTGAGHAILSASVYREEARKCITAIVDAEVYFRRNDVKLPWLAWRDAHVNVETTQCGNKFPMTYRVGLLKRLDAHPDSILPPGSLA